MIQRIQSIYLLLAALLLASLFFVDVLSWTGNSPENGGVVEVNAAIDGFQLKVAELTSNISGTTAITLQFLVGFLIVLSVLSIFQYNSRDLQIKLSGLVALISFALVILIGYMSFETAKDLMRQAPKFVFQPGISALLLATFFTLLARRSIRKDEKLVRSADRIR